MPYSMDQCKHYLSLQWLLEQNLLEVEKHESNIYKQLPDAETPKNILLHSDFHTNAQQNDIRYIYQMDLL